MARNDSANMRKNFVLPRGFSAQDIDPEIYDDEFAQMQGDENLREKRGINTTPKK
jgi:hypothetical protein